MENFDIEDIRQAWLQANIDQWERQIVDEAGSDEIVEIFKTVGWDWWLNTGERDGYRDTATFAWCGHFQSYCGLNLGHYLKDDYSVPLMLDPEIAQTVLASTYRVTSENKWSQAGYDQPAKMFEPAEDGGWIDTTNHERRAAEDVLLPGTIATIAAKDYDEDYKDEIGGHFVCIESVDGNSVDTIEGNAYGELYSGEQGEGVVRNRGEDARNLENFCRVIHFDMDHFDYISSV